VVVVWALNKAAADTENCYYLGVLLPQILMPPTLNTYGKLVFSSWKMTYIGDSVLDLLSKSIFMLGPDPFS